MVIRKIIIVGLIVTMLYPKSKFKYVKYDNVQFPDATVALVLNPRGVKNKEVQLIEIDLLNQKIKVIERIEGLFGRIPAVYTEINYNPTDLPPNVKIDDGVKMFKSHFTNQNIIFGMDNHYKPYNKNHLIRWKRNKKYSDDGKIDKSTCSLHLYNISNGTESMLYDLPYTGSIVLSSSIKYIENSNILLSSYSYGRERFNYDDHIDNRLIMRLFNNQIEILYEIDKGIFSWEFDYLPSSNLICHLNPENETHCIVVLDLNTNKSKRIISSTDGALVDMRFINKDWIIYIWNEAVDFFNDLELRIVNINTKENYTIMKIKGSANRIFKYDIHTNVNN